MPIPQNHLNDKKKVRCPFCDNVLGFGNFVGGWQMFCLDKHGKACGRLLEINLTEKGVEVKEVAKIREPPQMAVNQ